MSAQITQNQAVSSRVVKVLKGQKLVVAAFATFDKPEILTEGEGLNTTKKVANIAANTAALLSVQDVNIGTESKSKSLNINILAAIPLLKNLFTKVRNRHNIRVPLRPKQPKAFLEIAMYADSLQTELLSSRKIEITEKGEIFWEKLQDSLVLETDGFAVVSLKNNSDIPVLFDNLELRTYGTQKARIIQKNHYEPFGMTLQGLDYVAEDTRGNKFLYNGGVERQEELGLYWDDSHARGYNMQTGRFEQIDPLSEKYTGLTGYNFSFNNPTNLNDPSGLDPAESLEQWSARIQSEWARIDAGENPFDVWGFGGRGNSGTRQGRNNSTTKSELLANISISGNRKFTRKVTKALGNLYDNSYLFRLWLLNINTITTIQQIKKGFTYVQRAVGSIANDITGGSAATIYLNIKVSDNLEATLADEFATAFHINNGTVIPKIEFDNVLRWYKDNDGNEVGGWANPEDVRAAYLTNVVRTELNIPLRQNYNYFQLHGNLTPEQTFGRKTEADKLYLQFNKNSNYIQNYQNAAAKYRTIWKSLTGE